MAFFVTPAVACKIVGKQPGKTKCRIVLPKCFVVFPKSFVVFPIACHFRAGKEEKRRGKAL